MPTAGSVMTTRVVSVREDATLRQALALLDELDVRHLPVVNASREVVGLVSDRDLLRVRKTATALEQPVSLVMSADVLSVDAETDLVDVIDVMLEHRVGAVPVMDGDGRLSGIVSYVDVLRLAAKELAG